MTMQTAVTIDLGGLESLIALLRADGWSVVGPRIVDGVITHGPIESLADLPHNTGDEQDAAHYRLVERADDALFGYAVGPQSWKPSLFPARELLRRSSVDHEGGEPTPDEQPQPEVPRLALVGVRSCDLRAIAVHDDVLMGRVAQDVRYAARRHAVLVVAVTCADPASTCFCVSMGTGPEPQTGFDIALTELADDIGHRFVARAGTDRGEEILGRLDCTTTTADDLSGAADVVSTAVARMGRHLDTSDLRDLLYDNADHPQWDDVANRCLACGNCTLVCPTCFCTTVVDSTDLVDGSSERWRVWDSCFTGELTQLESGAVRASTRSRYRQWATHKLASWWDQFGSSGCVGCGRCITWCPAAIDITAEVAAIRATSPTSPTAPLATGNPEA